MTNSITVRKNKDQERTHPSTGSASYYIAVKCIVKSKKFDTGMKSSHSQFKSTTRKEE